MDVTTNVPTNISVAGRLLKDERDPDLSMYDDLKFQTMAQHKAIVEGDILRYELLENHMLTRASYKGMALSSSSIELVENIMEKEKKRRPATRLHRDYSEEFDGDPALVNNQESNSDIRSSKFYWEEIEPTLQPAGYILDSSNPPNQAAKDEAKQKYLGNCSSSPNRADPESIRKAQSIDLSKKKASLEMKQNKKKKQRDQVDVYDMNKRIKKLEEQHELELRNYLMVAKHGANEYFKSKSETNNVQYNKEMKVFLKEYISIKKKLFEECKKNFELI